jgi:thioredoxin reductase (NADPH)
LRRLYLISPAANLPSGDHPALQEPNLKVLAGYKVTGIEGREVVERIRMLDPEGKEAELELAGVFVYLHGNKPVVDFLLGALDTGEDGCIPINSMMETLFRVFAAGILLHRDTPGCCCSIHGCIAASRRKYLYKRKKIRMD